MAAINRVHPMVLSRTLGRIASKADHSRPWSFESAFTANQFKGHGQCFHVADLSKSIVRNKSNQYTCFSTLKTLATPDTQVHEDTVKRISQGVGQSHIDWWSQKLQHCRKPLTKEMMKRLKFNNPLGLDESLRGGSLKKGTKSAELLEMKTSYPRDIFLCRTGDIYEAVGIDACILVEYVGVAPVGRKDSVPKAGCPAVNLRQAIDDLTQEGFSVCVVEEVQGSATGRGRRKERFIAGHAEEDDDSQEESPDEAVLEEGELPEELRQDLESAAWSVGLDGLNVSDVPSNACVLGIDPDASGAIAVLRATSQEVLDVPCLKVQIGKTMRRRHDASSIVDLVNKINAPEGSVAYVEQAMPFPKDGKQGWYGCGFGYGMWVGILMALGFKVVPVRAQAWKSAMGIAGKQYTKDDSRNLAMALFPDLGPQLKRKKDHGRADAILIAAFGKGLSPPPKILVQETELVQLD